MSWTLQAIQNAIANEVDQDDSAPVAGGTDWNIRLNLINRSQEDWAETYDWSALLQVHNGYVTTAGFATYGLPVTFKKLDSSPKVYWDGSNCEQFPVINPTASNQYNDSDKYVYVQGNSRDSQSLYIHANTLASGASVQFNFYSSPVSLASADDVTQCPDPSYLVQRTLYYIYKGREDGRFPEAKVEADRILGRMIENENTLGRSHTDNRIPRWEETHYSFRLGRD